MDKLVQNNIVLSSPGLAIHGASSALAKTTNSVGMKIDGQIYAAVAAGDLTAFTTANNVADTYTNCITISVKPAGTYVYTMGTAILTATITSNATGSIFPEANLASVPAGQALVGYIIIKNAIGSGTAFVGGTTNLDATGVTVTYINAIV